MTESVVHLDDRYMSREELNTTYMNQDNSLTIKIGTPEEDSEEIEGIDLYTFNGTEEKIISILEGSNIEFSKENGVITISTIQEPLKSGQNITIGSDNSINANNMKTSYYGECSTNGSVSKKEINNVEDFELKKGVIIGIKFTTTNTANNVTLNVNESGDKNIGYNGGIYVSNSPDICGKQNVLNYYLYDGTYWVYLGRSNFDIYTPEKLGFGYGTCDTPKTELIKIVNDMLNYDLIKNGIVSIKFTNDVDFGSFLKINGKPAKNIYYQGNKIADNIIKANDIATFIYDGVYYHLLSIDQSYQRKLEAGNFITINEETNTINVNLSDYYNKTQIDSNYYNKTQINEEYYTKDQVKTFVNDAINTALKDIFTGKIGDIEYVDGQIIAKMYESNDDTILS